MPQFTEVHLDDPNREQSLQLIREYNRRFSDEPRPFMDYLRDIPVLVPNLLRQMFTLSGLMLMFRLRILLLLISTALYIISPLDIMPEAFFGVFGLLDDIFVAFLLLVYLCIAYRQFLRV
uniref:RING-type E3 ubiquitin transferase n=1 Tax=Romanomermis culicivorax TaxID=13658 RepID=A0A915HIF1_ROMCU